MDINTINWKGVSSSKIAGLLIQELPPITKPPMRFSETMVDGRDGSIIEELGYAPYDKSVKIALYGSYDVDAVIAYFTGSGNLILSNEPDKVYTAQIVSQIDFNRLVRYRTAVVKFRVQPYKLSATETEYTFETSERVKNNGNTVSKPKITIFGSYVNGTIEFKRNGTTVFTYEFPTDSEGVLILDCEKEEAVNEHGVLRNRYMVGEYPTLTKGTNRISVTARTGKINVTIRNQSRWI